MAVESNDVEAISASVGIEFSVVISFWEPVVVVTDDVNSPIGVASVV